jgi:ribosome biogenesis GTPase A
VNALLNRIEKSELLKFYRIGNYDTTEQFLGQVARKRGMLGNGGIANMDAVARAVIRDYMNGKIAFFTTPPENEDLYGEEDDADDDVKME